MQVICGWCRAALGVKEPVSDERETTGICSDCLAGQLADVGEVVTGEWNVSRAEYHRDRTCTSNGALNDFRRSIPLHHGRYVLGTIHGKEPTEAMSMGTALHTLVLEPHKWQAEIAITPEGIDRRTKIGKADWASFQATSGGKTIITQEQADVCHAMRDAILADETAAAVLSLPGPVEQPIRWRDEESGLWVRNLLDKWVPSIGTVVDLKTSSDPTPSEFARSVANFKYHCQAALYKRGAEAVYGVPCDFLFVVVGTETPHEVACFQLDSEGMELGERLNRDALNELAERRRTNNWASRTANRVTRIALPKYAFFQ